MRDVKFLLIASALTAVINPAFGSRLDGEPLSCDDALISIANQTEIDFYSACPEIRHTFGVSHDFIGRFEVRNVTSILGRFNSGYLGRKLKLSDRVDDKVTSISMPDLEEVGGWVLIGYLNELTNVSFPKLHSIGVDMAVVGNPKLKSIAFPELKNVTSGVLIDGDFNEVSFPKLKQVGFMQVKSTGDLDCRALGKNLSSLVFHPNSPSDEGKGFTCWTFDENNRYNSSDPEPTGAPTGAGPKLPYVLNPLHR
ncbi:hypothetical protein ACJ72_03443 [Emergomyces africanus]|uniref:Receptor L-domain domain-containing protein n=1 Tax=Emergomyces africanus TaxID=1955775 RepID=A0A1B7NZM1_9EURO|nr:hypothetical protein ACJ72_03443 [Emergomyces africanus]